LCIDTAVCEKIEPFFVSGCSPYYNGSNGGKTVVVNGNGWEADINGLSEEEQLDLAWDGASKCATASVDRTGRGNVNYAIGFLQVNGDRKEVSMMSTRHGSQHYPDSSNELQEPWLRQSSLIGHPLEQEDDYAGALVIYNRVLERDPEHILALLLKGRALLNLERGDEAEGIFRQVVQHAERSLQEHPENVGLWIYKGDALHMLAFDDAALDAYDQAIGLAPDNAEAYRNKGWLLFSLNKHDEALEAFDQALQRCPDDPDIFYRRGCVLWEMQRYEEALQDTDRAIALDPVQPRFFLAKSTTLSSLNREEESRQAYMHYRSLELMRKSA
jgi:tetratricopeptide (TPR) repeat protein